MSEVLVTVLGGAGVHLLAVVSPGPNFLVVSRTALAHSRRAALGVTAGVTVGAAVMIGAGFLGASAVFTRSATLYNLLRLTGAGYLILLGSRALIRVLRHHRSEAKDERSSPAPSTLAAFRLGLFTIASNAKAFVYLFVFFTAVVSPDAPLGARLTLVLLMPAITFGWYSVVATAFSNERLRRSYARLCTPIEVAFGLLLVLLGVEVGLAL